MKTVNATEIKNHFGEYLDAARAEPVVVIRNGRNVAALISWEMYERLEALDDAYWAERAMQAEKSGYLSPEDSKRAMANLLKHAER
jgi:prevent-host-death family protein